MNCKVVESDPGCRSHTKALLKAGAEDREVSECEGVLKGRNGGESKPAQMRCPSSTRIETPDWHRQQDQQEIKGSPRRDRGDGCTLIAYRSSDHADHLSSALEPAQRQLNTGRHLFGEIDQEAGEASNGKPQRRRRRRRRKVKRHPDRRENHDVPKHLRDKTYRGARSRGHADHASRRKSHYHSSGGRHSFLQSLWRAIRRAHRLFCL